MNRFFSTAFVFLTAFGVAPAVRADFDHPLYLAADHYRDTVREFERLSDRVRYLDSYTERAVDRLYGASNLLRVAARNPRDVDRLLDRYYDVVGLQDRIEATLFATGYADPRLAACWTDVRRAFAVVATHLEGGGGFGGVASRLPPSFDPRLAPSPLQSLRPAFPASPFPASPFQAGPFQAGPFGVPSQQGGLRVSPRDWPRSCDNTFGPSAQRFPASPFAEPRRISSRYDAEAYGIPELSGRQVRTRGGDLISIGAQLMRLLD